MAELVHFRLFVPGSGRALPGILHQQQHGVDGGYSHTRARGLRRVRPPLLLCFAYPSLAAPPTLVAGACLRSPTGDRAGPRASQVGILVGSRCNKQDVIVMILDRKYIFSMPEGAGRAPLPLHPPLPTPLDDRLLSSTAWSHFLRSGGIQGKRLGLQPFCFTSSCIFPCVSCVMYFSLLTLHFMARALWLGLHGQGFMARLHDQGFTARASRPGFHGQGFTARASCGQRFFSPLPRPAWFSAEGKAREKGGGGDKLGRGRKRKGRPNYSGSAPMPGRVECLTMSCLVTSDPCLHPLLHTSMLFS